LLGASRSESGSVKKTHTHTHEVTDATDHTNHGSATGVGKYKSVSHERFIDSKTELVLQINEVASETLMQYIQWS